MGASWPMLRRWLPAMCIALLFTAKLSCAYTEVIDVNPNLSGGTEGDTNLDQQGSLYGKCIAEDGREGWCLYPTQCYSNYSIAIGGVILTNELRDGSSPGKCLKWLWCCTYDTFFSTSGCVRVFPEEETKCPWCVALYRPGGDVSRRQRTASGLYCAGALVGVRVVLTSATCVRSAGQEATWARVPASANPARRYSVVQKIAHENYNSGTHANDFGLLVLNENVQWDEGPDPSKGACIGLQSPLEGSCFAAGFDKSEGIVMTAVTVRSGYCQTRRRSTNASNDVACGTTSDELCPIVPGAPVVCPTVRDEQGGLVITGVVRQNCIKGSAKLGKIQMHEQWLQSQLQRLGVNPIYYQE